MEPFILPIAWIESDLQANKHSLSRVQSIKTSVVMTSSSYQLIFIPNSSFPFTSQLSLDTAIPGTWNGGSVTRGADGKQMGSNQHVVEHNCKPLAKLKSADHDIVL